MRISRIDRMQLLQRSDVWGTKFFLIRRVPGSSIPSPRTVRPTFLNFRDKRRHRKHPMIILKLLFHSSVTPSSNLRPSQYNDPQLPFEVSGNAFVVTIPDDDNPETPLERFVNSTNANLASMRQEFERGLKTLRAELEAAAITRLAHL